MHNLRQDTQPVPVTIVKTEDGVTARRARSYKTPIHALRRVKARVLLRAYCLTGSIAKAAAAARTDTSMHYYWLRTLPGYAEAFAYADDCYGDLLEAHARALAVDGESVDMTKFLLKGHKRAKYADAPGSINVNATAQALSAQDRDAGVSNITDHIARLIKSANPDKSLPDSESSSES